MYLAKEKGGIFLKELKGKKKKLGQRDYPKKLVSLIRPDGFSPEAVDAILSAFQQKEEFPLFVGVELDKVGYAVYAITGGFNESDDVSTSNQNAISMLENYTKQSQLKSFLENLKKEKKVKLYETNF